MSKQVVRLTLVQQVKLIEYLKGIGQDTIDKLNLSMSDLAERGSKELGVTLSKFHVRGVLEASGLRSAKKLTADTAFRLKGGPYTQILAKLDAVEAGMKENSERLAALDEFIRFAIGEKK